MGFFAASPCFFLMSNEVEPEPHGTSTQPEQTVTSLDTPIDSLPSDTAEPREQFSNSGGFDLKDSDNLHSNAWADSNNPSITELEADYGAVAMQMTNQFDLKDFQGDQTDQTDSNQTFGASAPDAEDIVAPVATPDSSAPRSSLILRQLPPVPKIVNPDEVKTLKYYLKQAYEAKDMKALKDLLKRAKDLQLSDSDELVKQSSERLEDMESSIRAAEIAAIKFYIKQAMEAKSREALKTAISKADSLQLGSNRLNSDFFILVNEAKKMLTTMDTEDAQTIAFYLKQGIQIRNRDILKESCAKAHLLKPGTIDDKLLQEASNMLKHLDAEALILFYVDNACKQKDTEALESALNKATALKMSPSMDKIKEGYETLMQLKKKKRHSISGVPGSSKGGIRGIFGSGKKGKLIPEHRLFGARLEDAVGRSKYIIPTICYTCVEFIKAHGLKEPGLFRISGNADVMEAIKHAFEEEEDVKLNDVNDTAGVFKQYLRSLPEPLIPFAHYKAFLQIGAQFHTKDPQRIHEVKKLIGQLPRVNINLLSYLMFFLYELSKNEATTKMNANNLAIVFAPNLLRPEVETSESMLTEMPTCIGIIAYMIAEATQIFEPLPASLLSAPAAPV